MDRESDRGSSGTGSGRGTPRSIDHETMRCDTPGTMPTYMYSADELYGMQKCPASLAIPECLEKEFIVEGIWDPERWVRGGSAEGSRGGSRGPSPLTMPENRRETFRRNSGSERSADPKERLKEEKDIIVLSPQRRSFGTGCHVSHQQPLLQRALSNIEAERDRRDPRRIGSGRIQIDRERTRDSQIDRERTRDSQIDRERTRDSQIDRERTRDTQIDRERTRESQIDRERTRESQIDRERTRGSERSEPEYSARTERSDRHVDKDPRDFRSPRDREVERDRDRDFRNPRDRFERDDRRFDRDRLFSRRDMEDRSERNTHRDRDFRDHGSRYNHRRDRRDSNKEEEPEWFSGGPISKTDTIELHGFERERRASDHPTNEDKAETHTAIKTQEKAEDREEGECSESEDQDHNEGISVSDRNGSLETNESSSPETNGPECHPTKTDTQPPPFDFLSFFSNLPGLFSAEQEDVTGDVGSSRFFQKYRGEGRGQQGKSSRENSRRSSLIEEEFGYLNDLLNGSRSPVIPSPPPPSANMLFDRSSFLSPFASSDKQHHLEFGNDTFVTALINNAVALDRNRSIPPDMKSMPSELEPRLKALLYGRLDSNSSSGNTTPGFNSPLNVGKVKTVAELEGELQRSREAKGVYYPASARPHGNSERSTPQGEGDLSAFNKLITLMQAGEARPVESPSNDSFKYNQLVNLMQAGTVRTAESPKLKTDGPSVTHIPSHFKSQQMMQGGTQGMQVSGQPQQAPPPQAPLSHMQQAQYHIHGRMIQKIDSHGTPGQQQNVRGSLDEIQFDMMDGYHGNMTPPPSFQHPINLSDASAAQKQFFEALQRNKEEQLQKRQAVIQTMRLQQNMGPGSAQVQLTPSGSQQQSSQARRPSSGDPIMNFLKANPTIITKPASPTPPPQQGGAMAMMGVIHPPPRGPTPSPVLQSALLQRQAPGTPRVPSPIMFSQQPPMHLNAPSPIHPAQGGSLPQSPVGQTPGSVNSIRPPAVPRVPSPQELIVHTQAILQNALIKKQLEDQKERFYKKQQESLDVFRVKSPNLLVAPPPGSVFSVATPTVTLPPAMSTSTPAKAPVNVAFTPTSVIRKMHSEKANEKEKLRRDSIDTEHLEGKEESQVADRELSQELHAGKPRPASPRASSAATTPASYQAPHTSIPPPTMLHTVPPPPLPNHNQVLPNLVSVLPPGASAVIPGILPPFNSNHMTHMPPPLPLVSTHLPPPLLSPGTAGLPTFPLPHGGGHQSLTLSSTQDQIDAAKSQHLRALLGQHSPNLQSVGVAVVTSGLPSMGRPIVKGNAPLTQAVSMTPSMQLTGALSQAGMSPEEIAKFLQRQQISSSPYSVPPRPGLPSPGAYGIPLQGRLTLPSGPILGAGQVSGAGTSPVLLQQIMQGVTPRGMNQFAGLQGTRMVDPRALRGQLPQGLVPVSLGNHHFTPRPLTPQQHHQQKNGPVSPGQLVSSMATPASKPESANLMKWFGSDVLKTSLSTMPPLPVQGQRVLTLDEIERS
ncbi:eukaryotic translation initiation factor 4E transporter-like isoform X2 [Dreissena polymorpha]|uniref:eukaryotic translation initiation factor 4E transporter-like isoform X2 n=1 Tax=Dreissena polymorpha TaxID=45954 RepID=UPI002264D794|nr:eukaryotic translation initiation factor 4E transporter-like isoform X2 [Dreissena polymorpha]